METRPGWFFNVKTTTTMHHVFAQFSCTDFDFDVEEGTLRATETELTGDWHLQRIQHPGNNQRHSQVQQWQTPISMKGGYYHEE